MLMRRRNFRSKGSVRPADLAYRPPLYSPEFPIVLFWSQKSACTTVAKWFFAHIGQLKRALNHHRWIHEYENNVFKARPNYFEDCAAALNSGVTSVKFVRNPYARLYSGYLETCNPRVLREPDHWSTQTRARVIEHLVGSDPGLEYAYSFNQFVGWLAEQSLDDIDVHLAPQFESFEEAVSPTILQIDSSEDVFEALEIEFDLPATKGRKQIYTSGHHHKKKELQGGVGASILDVAIPVVRSTAFQLIDAPIHVIANSISGSTIKELFEADFRAYDYSTEPGDSE